jgi:hypothetical protein
VAVADTRPTCSATKRDGSPCRTPALTGKPHCAFHDESVAERRAAGRKKGGVKSHRPPAVLPEDTPDAPLTTISEVCQLLGRVANLVLRGQVDARVANASVYALSTLAGTLAKSDLEQRLARVEQMLAANGGDLL